MKTFKLKISSPDGDIFNGDAVKISLRGTEGELAVMAGHIPFVTSVVPCKCKIDLDNETVKTASLEAGLLSVSPDIVILLSGSFNWDN